MQINIHHSIWFKSFRNEIFRVVAPNFLINMKIINLNMQIGASRYSEMFQLQGSGCFTKNFWSNCDSLITCSRYGI